MLTSEHVERPEAWATTTPSPHHDGRRRSPADRRRDKDEVFGVA
jgi:hypothetical protein